MFNNILVTKQLVLCHILIPVESCNLGNAKVLAIQRSKIGPYTHMNQFLIVEARGFGTAEIAAFKWNEYILIPVQSENLGI